MLADDCAETLNTVLRDMPVMMLEAMEGKPKLRTVTLLGENAAGQDVSHGFVLVVAPLDAGPALDAALASVFGPCISRTMTLVEEPDDNPTQEKA